MQVERQMYLIEIKPGGSMFKENACWRTSIPAEMLPTSTTIGD